MKAIAIGKPEDLSGYDKICKGLHEVDPEEVINM